MDQVPLLTQQIEDGQKLIEQLAQNDFPVTAAFWAKSDEDSQWYLYFVSPVVDDDGIGSAYRRVHSLIYQMQVEQSWIDPFRIKLLGPSEPLAQAVADILRRHPGKNPSRHVGSRLGNLNLEGVYIYPSFAQAK